MYFAIMNSWLNILVQEPFLCLILCLIYIQHPLFYTLKCGPYCLCYSKFNLKSKNSHSNSVICTKSKGTHLKINK